MLTPAQVFGLYKIDMLYMVALAECDVERMEYLENRRAMLLGA